MIQRCGGISCPPGTCDHTDDPADATVHRSAAPAPASGGTTGVPASVQRVLDTVGTPLDASTRDRMEARFGHDFGHVRVHTDDEAARSARSIQAHAYTFGSHIVMGAGRFQPHTRVGSDLLAHELTHVVQQADASGARRPTSISDPSDSAEQEAEVLAREPVHTVQHGGRSPGEDPSRVSDPSDPRKHKAEPVAWAAMSHTPETGGGVILPPAGPTVQRSCGAAEIGSVAGCAERGGDIADFGSTSEDVFLFVRDCDEMAAGESARFTSYAARIGPDDEVTIDGFASQEGPAEYNLDLACARARAVADLLSTVGANPASIRLYSHGATPGDRPTHRSVVITVAPGLRSRLPTATIFHPGVMHDHKPSGRWADVQANPNNAGDDFFMDFFINRACKNLSPREVIGAAIQGKFGDKPIALEHLNWYLFNGGGVDFDENANLEKLLRTESVVQRYVRAHISGRSSGTVAFSFPLDQQEYDSQDLRFAFGRIDRLDFEVDLSAGSVRAWFMDRYEWHPVYPFYSHFPDDQVRPTNCVHAAAVELKSSSARDYWMKGEVTVPLTVFRSAP